MSTLTRRTNSRPVPARTGMARRRPRRVRLALNYAATAAVSLVFAAPILYMLIGSVIPSDEVLGGLSAFTPSKLTTENFTGVVDRFQGPDTGYFWGFFAVSTTVTAVVVLGGLIVNSLAAYACARLNWPGRKVVLALVLALVVMPFETVAVPLFYLLSGARDTITVQAVPFIASAFTIFLFYSFFRAMPAEIEEAAKLDGAGPWRTYWSVIVPMSKPVFASAAILTFLTQWSSFLWPVLMVTDPGVRPLPLAISVFQGQPPYDWGQIMAFGVVIVAPVLIVFLAFQRWFVQSLAHTAVKG